MTKLLFAVAAIALSTNVAFALDCRPASYRRLSRLLGAVAVLSAVLVSFSDRARAEDEDCSKLFKSDYLREVCSDVGIPSHRQSYVKMECSILKAGHESPSNYPRSSKVIADTERALKDCIIMLAARSQKITFGELRDMGVCGVLVYCADYHCSHSVALSADHWPDEMRLSPRETCDF